MSDIREVTDAASAYLKARQECDEAYASGPGYDWDYFGHRRIEDVQQAESKLQEVLEAYVEKLVQRALAKEEEE